MTEEQRLRSDFIVSALRKLNRLDDRHTEQGLEIGFDAGFEAGAKSNLEDLFNIFGDRIITKEDREFLRRVSKKAGET